MPNTQPTSWRDQINVHPAADLFPMMTPDELKALGEDIKKNGLAVPVMMWQAEKGGPVFLLDGRNRLDAAEAVRVPVLKRDGLGLDLSTCPGDPYEYVLSVNAHRRHLTPEQKREVIAKILQARPEKSDRQIAKQVKVDHKTVGAVRGKQEDVGKIPHVEKRTDTRGRAQPARKPTTANGNARATTRKPTMKKSGSSGLLNSLAWSDASVAQRTRFLDAVGVKTVWDAMSPSMKDAVRELANVKPPEPMKPAPSNARPDLAIPADGSITEFLKRA